MQRLGKYCKIMVFRDSNCTVKIRVGRLESGKTEGDKKTERTEKTRSHVTTPPVFFIFFFW